MYVVAFSSDDQKHYLHALDLSDGLKDRVPAAVIEPPAGMVTPQEVAQGYRFALNQRNRPALLRMNGIIYIAFGSFICDAPGPFAGWVFGYTADLKQASAWRTPPNVTGDGIWQAGRGLVGAPDNSIYFETGNMAIPASGKLANSFVKLGASCSEGLKLAAVFEPSNSPNLSNGDTDLGSSGPILIRDRLIGGGKEGRVYVLDAKTMKLSQDAPYSDGGQGFPGFVNTYHNDPSQQACTHLPVIYNDGTATRMPPDGGNAAQYCRNLNSIQNGKPGFNWPEVCTYNKNCYLPVSCYQFCQTYGPNLHAGFVYWEPAAAAGNLYAMPEKEYLRMFRFDFLTNHLVENPVKRSPFRVPDGMPGAALALSANRNRSGIVWASMPRSDDATNGVHIGSLVAADALDLHELWRDDCIRYFAKFNPPVFADGKVILATFADPTRQAVPGQGCQDPVPTINGKLDYGAPPNKLQAGSAWLMIYGLRR
jgi:hypothetical protein